jgi:hypothetical protein
MPKGTSIEGEHPYVYLDGIVLKRSWAGEVRDVSLLVAIANCEDWYYRCFGGGGLAPTR